MEPHLAIILIFAIFILIFTGFWLGRIAYKFEYDIFIKDFGIILLGAIIGSLLIKGVLKSHKNSKVIEHKVYIKNDVNCENIKIEIE